MSMLRYATTNHFSNLISNQKLVFVLDMKIVPILLNVILTKHCLRCKNMTLRVKNGVVQITHNVW
jgi:hypothetical protein